MVDNIILFLHLCETKNFSTSALLLNIRPSTFSRRIKTLEDVLGKQLIIRTSKTFEVTEFGNYIYNQFKHLPDFVNYTLDRYNSIASNNQIRGIVNLACGEAAAEKIITPRLPEFLAEHPNINLNISCINNITKWPSENINIVLSPVPIKSSGLVNRFVRTEYVQLFCFADYVVRNGIPKEIEDLKHHKIVGMLDDNFVPFEFVRVHNFNTKKEDVLDLRGNIVNINSPIQQYKIGKTLNHLFSSFKAVVNKELKSGEIIPVLPEWSLYGLDFHIVTKKKPSPEEEIVIDFLFQCFRLCYL